MPEKVTSTKVGEAPSTKMPWDQGFKMVTPSRRLSVQTSDSWPVFNGLAVRTGGLANKTIRLQVKAIPPKSKNTKV